MQSRPHTTTTDSTEIRCLTREEWKPGYVTWEITSNEPKAIGESFEFSILTKVTVDQSRGVDSKICAFKRNFKMQQTQIISVPFSKLKALPYRGKNIKIACFFDMIE